MYEVNEVLSTSMQLSPYGQGILQRTDQFRPDSVASVAHRVLDRADAMNEALSYLSNAMLNALHNLPKHRQLYSLKLDKQNGWL